MSVSAIRCGSYVSFRAKAKAARCAGVNSDQSPSRAAISSSLTPATASLISWWPSQWWQLLARETIQKNIVLKA
jgi:hypothetical protein